LERIRIGLVGIGKIARDQHIPVLQASPEFELVAAASRHSKVDGLANFESLEAMLDGCALDAVAIATPPQEHFAAGFTALSRAKHVLLEKPPCGTTMQLDILASLAAERKRTLFQSWHSRFAPAVALAAEVLQGRRIRRATITWKEDVRRWHPGQRWIWQAGGFGVFDPGINALSILTWILPQSVFVSAASLSVPQNCEAPIAADLTLRSADGVEIAAVFDFRHTGTQTWEIALETDGETILLSQGGSVLSVAGRMLAVPDADAPHFEYASLYRRFAGLIGKNQSDVDARPFRLVADAFLIGRRIGVEAFHE
jgi:D-galactose 1-dehydrogenase